MISITLMYFVFSLLTHEVSYSKKIWKFLKRKYKIYFCNWLSNNISRNCFCDWLIQTVFCRSTCCNLRANVCKNQRKSNTDRLRFSLFFDKTYAYIKVKPFSKKKKFYLASCTRNNADKSIPWYLKPWKNWNFNRQ